MWVVLALAAIKLLVSLAVVNNYGYFRDELYYLACSEHLSWGYVDQPPLVAAITWLVRHTLGTSLFALRLLPTLAGTLTVLLAALLAREMRGGRIAQGIAALGTLLSTVYLGMDHLLTMNSFDVPLWMVCAWVVLRIVNTGNESLWLLFGAISGVTLLNKYGIGFFAVGIVAGLLLTPMRRSLARPWIWLGGALACLIFLPNFLWQANRGFPFLELMGNIRHSGRD
ncbi:MAG TPA: glycosyltransferase family 39 protein, partial [Bryobacteraceae bacterium]|nr:glycosyltransferase family 39 protein [Bryobacteraceae bacterium]